MEAVLLYEFLDYILRFGIFKVLKLSFLVGCCGEIEWDFIPNFRETTGPGNKGEVAGRGDEMLVKEYEYLVQKAKEHKLLEDIPLEEISVDDPDARIHIIIFVLGTKSGRQIHGLGDGHLRDIRTSFNVHNLEKELEIERAV
ncbi:Hypothetical predicted protein [Olea europaea subsp. europaea]|uniref:Uncharacterized protein n=1 Tax=Olea europaea subsp. europaea TaxID=158383 RepID=A0A8S0PGQ6_OLEEU|nr:Hypothetical predicted protein [Olea europaea subsp. europaea]